jgi:hypothetical protein
MTIKEKLRNIRLKGLTVSYIVDTREFRINYRKDSMLYHGEDSATYTDADDAINTAIAMKKHESLNGNI